MVNTYWQDDWHKTKTSNGGQLAKKENNSETHKPSTTKETGESEPVNEPVKETGSATLSKVSDQSLAVGTETAGVDLALKKGVGAAEDLGEKVAGIAEKLTKSFGYGVAAVATVQALDDLRNGNTGAAIVHGLDALAGVVGTLGPGGAAISLLYGVSRIFWGNE